MATLNEKATAVMDQGAVEAATRHRLVSEGAKALKQFDVDRRATVIGPALSRVRRLHWPIVGNVVWLVLMAVVYVDLVRLSYHGDAYIYWQSGRLGYPAVPVAGFVYPPPALLAFWPVQFLPYEVFYAGWLLLLMGVMRWLIGPWLMLAFIGTQIVGGPHLLGWRALASGNVSLLVGAGIAYGMTHPSGWMVPALTKVTSAVGLGWFVVRGEWKPLARSLGLIGAACLASFVVAPWLWPEWFHVIRMNLDTPASGSAFSVTAVPFLVRLPVAMLIVGLAAWRSAAWALPIAGLYALGWIGETTLLVGLGTVRLLRRR